MAEGILEGIIGGEEEAAEKEAVSPIVTAEAFAAAIAAHQAGYGPAVASATERFLDEQTHLLRTQARQIEQEQPLRLQHLHGAEREGAIRRLGMRLRVGVQIFTVLLLTGIGAGVATMLYDAVTSETVVIESFETPSALAPRGLSGKALASSVLDALAKMQAATRSTEKGRNAVGAWSSEIRIEVPETGVSIGEISRILHERLGHDLHIGGDLVQAKDGSVVLTVRGESIPAKSFSAGEEEIEKLTVEAAEYIYGRSQPVEYGRYLVNNSRVEDALAFLPGAVSRADDDAQRAELINYWANALVLKAEPVEAAAKYRLALSYVPGNWKYWHNLIGVLPSTGPGGEEASWREAQAFLKAADTAANKPPKRLFLNPAQRSWDLPLFLAAMQADASYNRGAGATNAIDGPALADIYALMHDSRMAERSIITSDPEDPVTQAEARLLRSYAAVENGNAAAAVPDAQAFWQAWQNQPGLKPAFDDHQCFVGLVLGLAGKMAEAEMVFKAAGPYARCFAYHGAILDHAGRADEAARIWAEGLRIGPDLTHIYFERGLSEMRRGDVKAAGADLATAAAKAPHFADPLKAWGDLLGREGRWGEAVAKYDEALKYAPAWQQLKQAREDASRRVR